MTYYLLANILDVLVLCIGGAAVIGLHHWLTTRPKRNRYRPTHDPRNWMATYRRWWAP